MPRASRAARFSSIAEPWADRSRARAKAASSATPNRASPAGAAGSTSSRRSTWAYDRLPHRLARLLAPHEARDQAAGHLHPAVGEARLPGAERQRLDGGQDAAQVAVAPEPGDGEGREGVEEERGHGQAPHPEARLGDGEPPLLDADERRSRHVEPAPGPRDPDRGHARHAARRAGSRRCAP